MTQDVILKGKYSMDLELHLSEWFFCIMLILSALGVLLARKPIYACLSFLMTLLTLAILYLQLSAQFIAVMQVIVYAGAILVIFMFVIVLFQDAHQKIGDGKEKSSLYLISLATGALTTAFVYFGKQIEGLPNLKRVLPEDFGMVAPIGKELYVDFFFPFEALILLFLIAIVGSIYIARKVY
ncbi:Uncharacterized protein PHSC3_000719 [Chlamydiales bacterium STE3]|nr:Uncharacterized protein PHSC3_000719 [Chlamydiales bacterium STE3]